MMFQRITHCIFDFDGLLVDSEKLYYQVIDDILKEFGHRYTVELKLKVLGCTRFDCARTIIEHCKLSITAADFIERIESRCAKVLPECRLMPGAERLVRHLKAHGVPIAVATSSSLESLRLKTIHHLPFMSLFNHIVSGSDDPEVKVSKPAPDIFLVCARRFTSPVEGLDDCKRVLVFEDAPNGVKAAIAANMQVVMVPDPTVVSPEHRAEATLCVDSLEQFQPELFGLPPFSHNVDDENKKALPTRALF
ncbi:pseudouridine-5'-monophosphatase-like [Tropilaelaps mercedesae]|uniref:Pseudouridine-5'-monophosphatase-like n=1 Tax=Tropilaelaps mercedesae TaxID=418985 RepID=A0A1V9XNL4_9ACAR|nr:pseudouridine-5'-monophosphatase-like [Tropilaelaps mercedesae]